MSVAPRKPRLLVLNQYYWPGVEATAQLLAQLCEALSDEFEVTVVTGRLQGVAEEPGWTERNGVRILRVHSTAFERSRLAPRALNYVSYLAVSLTSALRTGRPDVILCMTDPPIIANVSLVVARVFRAPLVVVSQDVFPEIAIELGRLESPLLIGFLRWAIRYYLRRADRVVAIGETMRRRLEQKGARPERIAVITNWVDTSALHPEPRDNEWARANGLVGRFVVMHSGNVGHAQDLDSLVRAATFLRDLDNLRIVIVGNGARHAELAELAERLELDSITMLPYQPRERLSQSLSSADVHVVGLARGLAGYVVPSRLYGILSAERPVIVAAEADSETVQVVEKEGCGVVVPPGRPELLAQMIRRAHDGELDLVGMGQRGRTFVMAASDRSVAVAAYRCLLQELLAGGS